MRIVVISLFLSLLIQVRAKNSYYSQQFESFKQHFGKSYKSFNEESARFANFVNNLDEINKDNSSERKWKKGINQFSDMTKEEFKRKMNGYITLARDEVQVQTVQRSHNISLNNLPETVDWRESGAISEIKDQMFCAACWAFVAIEQIESYLQIKTGKTVEQLSAEHLTACSTNALSCGGDGGCAGSLPQLAFLYTQLFGLVSEADYPYTSGKYGMTNDCSYDPNSMHTMATLRGFETLPRNSYAAVMNHLANFGPLSVAVDASDWMNYRHGIYDSCRYDRNIELNHVVQLIGYGTDPDEGDYWLIRNSWDTWWGEDGFMRLKRESDPPCGTDNTPLSGGGCVNDGKDVLTVCGQCGILYDVIYPIGVDYVQH